MYQIMYPNILINMYIVIIIWTEHSCQSTDESMFELFSETSNISLNILVFHWYYKKSSCFLNRIIKKKTVSFIIKKKPWSYRFHNTCILSKPMLGNKNCSNTYKYAPYSNSQWEKKETKRETDIGRKSQHCTKARQKPVVVSFNDI